MIKRIFFLALFAAPSLAFGQAAPMRPNHTLPQYNAVIAANRNAGAPRTMLRTVAPSAGSYAALWPPGGIRRDTQVPSLYVDGSAGTLEQIGRMADSSVQQSDIGGSVAPLDANKMMSAPVSGDASSAPVAASGTPVARSLSDRFADTYSLRDLGARLDNSAQDKANIQTIYNALPDGAVVHIPKGSLWDGALPSPSPDKHINWLFDGIYAGDYSHPPGDGDTSISHKRGLQVSRMDTNTKAFMTSPAIFVYWNDDGNYCGAYCQNWDQYAAAGFAAISGPTSSGNTSPVTLSLRSFGQGPSSSYDVGLPVVVWKYGQNSTWGLDVVTGDLSGKSPGAFASWNEFDMWTNGQDIKSWDKNFGTPQAGHRSVMYVAGSHYSAGGWKVSMAVTARSSGKGGVSTPSLIDVQAQDQVNYIWYPVADGITGVSKPVFPAPARLNATLQNGALTVTRVVNGVIRVGDYITGANPIVPVRVTGQTSGDTGAVGIYTVDDKSARTDKDEALYAAPRVSDGSVSWQFGEETNSSISSVMWLTGAQGKDAYDTVIGMDKGVIINNAVLDATLANAADRAAIVRMAPQQVIDFSGDGTRAGANRHTLDYDNGALRYKVSGVPVLSIGDDGSLQSALPSRLPVMTRAQIRAYPSPTKGMEVYDSDDDAPAVYTGAGWKLMTLSTLPSN